MILNRGLTVDDDNVGVLLVRDKRYLSLLELADNKQMVRHLFFFSKISLMESLFDGNMHTF